MPKPQSWKIAFAWLAALVWAAMVWGFGADSLSQTSTAGYLAPLFEWLWPDLSVAQRGSLLKFIRKSAHVFEYAVLAALLLRAGMLSWHRSLLWAGLFSLGAVSALAIADELRQAESAVRTGSLGDVALDISGGLLAIALGWAIERRTEASSQPNEVG